MNIVFYVEVYRVELYSAWCRCAFRRLCFRRPLVWENEVVLVVADQIEGAPWPTPGWPSPPSQRDLCDPPRPPYPDNMIYMTYSHNNPRAGHNVTRGRRDVVQEPELLKSTLWKFPYTYGQALLIFEDHFFILPYSWWWVCKSCSLLLLNPWLNLFGPTQAHILHPWYLPSNQDAETLSILSQPSRKSKEFRNPVCRPKRSSLSKRNIPKTPNFLGNNISSFTSYRFETSFVTPTTRLIQRRPKAYTTKFVEGLEIRSRTELESMSLNNGPSPTPSSPSKISSVYLSQPINYYLVLSQFGSHLQPWK